MESSGFFPLKSGDRSNPNNWRGINLLAVQQLRRYSARFSRSHNSPDRSVRGHRFHATNLDPWHRGRRRRPPTKPFGRTSDNKMIASAIARAGGARNNSFIRASYTWKSFTKSPCSTFSALSQPPASVPPVSYCYRVRLHVRPTPLAAQ